MFEIDVYTSCLQGELKLIALNRNYSIPIPFSLEIIKFKTCKVISKNLKNCEIFDTSKKVFSELKNF